VSDSNRFGDARTGRTQAARAIVVADRARAIEWSRALCESLRAARAPISLTAAMRELLLVHRSEQARLLCGAVRLRCRATPLGESFLELRAPTYVASHWRTEAIEEVDSAWLDGWNADDALWECVSRPRDAWRSARQLARSASELEPSLVAALHRARAELCEGTPRLAVEMMRRILRARLTASERRPVLEGLALACEACGDLRAACAHHATACREPGAPAAAYAAWLALAFATGALADVAAIAAQRAARGASNDWDATDAQRLRNRIEHHRRTGRWRLSDGAQSRARAWVKSDDAVARDVATAVLWRLA
jgi:hypothetical protein